jgi:hypothetical protein
MLSNKQIVRRVKFRRRLEGKILGFRTQGNTEAMREYQRVMNSPYRFNPRTSSKDDFLVRKKAFNAVVRKQKATRYSVTVVYKQYTSWKSTHKTTGVVTWGPYKFKGSKTHHEVRKKRMNSTEASRLVTRQEREANQRESYEQHLFEYVKVENLAMRTDRRLEDSKMFKANYTIFSEKVSDWVDSGEMMCVYEFLIHRYNGNSPKSVYTRQCSTTLSTIITKA